jgi:hypothetical protein
LEAAEDMAEAEVRGPAAGALAPLAEAHTPVAEVVLARAEERERNTAALLCRDHRRRRVNAPRAAAQSTALTAAALAVHVQAARARLALDLVVVDSAASARPAARRSLAAVSDEVAATGSAAVRD